MLLSPLGERLGEGVMQETAFVLHPLTWPLPQGGEESEGVRDARNHFAISLLNFSIQAARSGLILAQS
jgi:hypothetical protein